MTFQDDPTAFNSLPCVLANRDIGSFHQLRAKTFSEINRRAGIVAAGTGPLQRSDRHSTLCEAPAESLRDLSLSIWPSG
jgi:hypothetical protein